MPSTAKGWRARRDAPSLVTRSVNELLQEALPNLLCTLKMMQPRTVGLNAGHVSQCRQLQVTGSATLSLFRPIIRQKHVRAGFLTVGNKPTTETLASKLRQCAPQCQFRRHVALWQLYNTAPVPVRTLSQTVSPYWKLGLHTKDKNH